MRKRIFIGIPISRKLQEKIESWIKNNLRDFRVKFVPKENLHITIIAPWNEENIETAIDKLKKVKGEIKPFEIKFNKVTFGPKKRSPRLIWAEGETPDELLHLYELLHEKYEKPKEKRPFFLHLTLARFRPKDFHNLKLKKLDRTVSLKQTVDRVILFESRLSQEGAKYEILTEIKL